MSELIEIVKPKVESPIGDIVFVHGLGGSPNETWSGKGNFYWPAELGKELVNIRVWALGYNANPSNWLKKTMELPDLAENVIEAMTNIGIGERPLIFICHSLGGLLVKQILRISHDRTDEKSKIKNNTSGIIFLATPHSGSIWADIISKVPLLQTSPLVGNLKWNDAHLRDLNHWFRDNFPKDYVQVYTEKYLTNGLLIVDSSSADPGNGIRPIPVHANHIDICKPSSTEDLVYSGAKYFVEKMFRSHTVVVEEAILKFRIAARTDINSFKNKQSWPEHAVLLNMTMKKEDRVHVVSLVDIIEMIEFTDEITIVAAPGTGKTTMMVQLADAMHSLGRRIAVVIPLAEWSSRSDTFFQILIRRNAFNEFNEKDFTLLASKGRLLLLLDGWNELDFNSKLRAWHEYEALKRDFPLLGVIISTRRQAQDIPINGPVLEITELSEKQQLEIACKLRGEEGVALLEQAWRTEGIKELVAIPLYLKGLLAYTITGSMPKTKEEVLRQYVKEYEKEQGRSIVLRRELWGVHNAFLTGLAVKATDAANTTMQDNVAIAVISQVENELAGAGQLIDRPQPTDVLDLLVNRHLLVRSEGNNVVFFQHQQFQEWFASFEVERLMYALEADDKEALRRLTVNVLNMPAWEEPILFACERISSLGQGRIKVVAAAILRCISIDPILAAEMIFRSSQDVWDIIKDQVKTFVAHWHKKDTVDRAVRFMITTGKLDFAETIWPLITSSDSQVRFRALRSARVFRPSVLGPNIRERIALMAEEVRESVVAEIALESGIDGINLATTLAKTETSTKVQYTVIEALLFRRAERSAASILKDAKDIVWQMVARNGYIDDISDTQVAQRLRQERQSYIMNQAGVLKKIELLLKYEENRLNIGEQIESLILTDGLPTNDQNTYWILEQAKAQYPQEVARAILHRIELGREIPFRSRELIKGLEFVEEGPIINRVVDTSDENPSADIACVVIGPQTVTILIDKYFLLCEKIDGMSKPLDEAARKEFWRIVDRICSSSLNAFLLALQNYSKTDDPKCIARMADLLARHGKNHEEGLLVERGFCEFLTITINQWIEVLLKSSFATRHQFSEVVRVIARYPEPELFDGLQRLLAEDLAIWKQAKMVASNSAVHRQLTPDVTHSYTNLYRSAFVAVGGENVINLMLNYLPDLDFGFEAACVLNEIWDKQQNVHSKNRFGERPDFAKAVENYRQRQGKGFLATSTFSEEIFAVIDNILKSNCGEAEYRHILKLARIALSMPHGDKTLITNNILSVPGLLKEKRELLASLVLAGYKISADLVLSLLTCFLEEIRQNFSLEKCKQIENWVELLPFSDRPEALHEALALTGRNDTPWEHRRLLVALAHAPNDQAEASLFRLAEHDPRFYEDHEWFNAVVTRGTTSSATKLLDLIYSGKVEGMGRRSLPIKITDLFRKHPDQYKIMLSRYRLLPTRIKSVLKIGIAEIADQEGLLTLVRSYGQDGLKFNETLNSMIRQLALGKKSTEYSNVFEYYAVDVAELRKQLFSMREESTSIAQIVEACLIAIDELRDEYGSVDSEPRHPDIDSGHPWPLVGIHDKAN